MIEVVRLGQSGRALAILGIVCTCVLGLSVTSGSASAAPAFDVVVKDQKLPSIDVVRPKKDMGLMASSLHRTAFATTRGRPLEIWAHRPEPAGPLVIDDVDRSSGKPVATTIPALRARLDTGLIDFLEYRVRNDKGKIVAESRETLCPNGQDAFGGYKSGVSARTSGVLGPQPMLPRIYTFMPPCGEQQAESLVWMFGRGNPLYYGGGRPIDLPDGDYVYEAVVNPDGVLPEKTLANNRFRQRFSLQTDRDEWRRLLFGSRTESRSDSGSSSDSGRASSTRRFARPSGGRPRAVKPPSTSDIDGPAGALPDPVALPASRFAFTRENSRERISFSSIVSNAGDAPIVLFGKRRGREGTDMPGWQYTKDPDGKVQKRAINGFVWDQRDTHFHWHYNKLAVYELLDPEGNVLRRSDKVGFCFMPTTLLNFVPVPGAVGKGAPLWFDDDSGPTIDCGRRRSRRVAMSLPAGWGDEYWQGIAGQSLDVTALPAGDYRLRITVNPEGDLAESDSGNNVSERLITLGAKGADRSLTVPRQGIVSPEFHRLGENNGLPFGAGSSSAGLAGTSALRGPAGPPGIAASGASFASMYCGLRGN